MYFYNEVIEIYKNEGMEMTWVMKDGSEIKLKDMKDSHIQNCINMLKRNEPTDMRKAWIDIFEDVKIKRRGLKLIEIVDKIKNIK